MSLQSNSQEQEKVLKIEDLEKRLSKNKSNSNKRRINSFYKNNDVFKDFIVHKSSELDETIEPYEYFLLLKSKFSTTELNYLFNSLDYLLEQVNNAKRIQQKKLLEIIHFNSKNILREILLNIKGINKFVNREDLLEFIDYVQPEGSVKMIELERFHRTIPAEVVDRIAEVKSFNLFDKYFILFTDLTNQSFETSEEKDIIARNRDPIVFGYFKDNNGWVGERFYPIADWEDEYCDLTLDKLTDQMVKMKIGQGVQSNEDFQSLFEKSLNKLIDNPTEKVDENEKLNFQNKEMEEHFHILEQQVLSLKELIEDDEEITFNLDAKQVEELLKTENQLKGHFKTDRDNFSKNIIPQDVSSKDSFLKRIITKVTSFIGC